MDDFIRSSALKRKALEHLPPFLSPRKIAKLEAYPPYEAAEQTDAYIGRVNSTRIQILSKSSTGKSVIDTIKERLDGQDIEISRWKDQVKALEERMSQESAYHLKVGSASLQRACLKKLSTLQKDPFNPYDTNKWGGFASRLTRKKLEDAGLDPKYLSWLKKDLTSKRNVLVHEDFTRFSCHLLEEGNEVNRANCEGIFSWTTSQTLEEAAGAMAQPVEDFLPTA